MIRTAWLATSSTALALLTSTAAASAQSAVNSPPAGEDRATMVAAIRKAYPTMPDAIVQLDADIHRQLDENAPCALVDWLLRPDSVVPANVRGAAQTDRVACVLPAADVTAQEARDKLGDRPLRFEISDGVITILAHAQASEVQICCSLQDHLRRIGTSDYWVSRRRLARSDEAVVSLAILPPQGERLPDPQVWRGPNAPAPPPVASKLAGQLLERELKSASLGETRRLEIYLPPGWTKDRTWPALFLADGAAGSYAPMVEQLIDEGRIAPIVLVSALAGDRGVVGDPPKDYGADLRSAEYIRNFPGAKDRFDRHMAFFSGELVDYAVSEFDVSRRREDHGVAGFSNGGVLSLWAGLLHPEVFSMAVPMSPGVAPVTPADLTLMPRARFWMAAGLYEPSFQRTAQAAQAALSQAGYQVSGRYLVAGHDPTQWAVVLQDALTEMFPARTPPATAPGLNLGSVLTGSSGGA